MRTNLNFLFLLLLFSFVFSCRTIPEDEKFANENISPGEPVLVKINYIDVDFENNNLENGLVSENNSRGGGVIL